MNNLETVKVKCLTPEEAAEHHNDDKLLLINVIDPNTHQTHTIHLLFDKTLDTGVKHGGPRLINVKGMNKP